MSLDNLPATQTVTAPNTQTIISLAVPGTGRLLRTSLARQRQRRGRGREGGKGGWGATAWGLLVAAVWAQSGSRPPASVIDRPDAQSNLGVKGTKLTTLTVPRSHVLKSSKISYRTTPAPPPTPTTGGGGGC